jgi:L-ascorbate metabolism protein UlaG (beta-lactamase superfamily)
MGPEDAVKAVQFLQPKQAILMHYNTFGLITQDAQAVADAIRQQTSSQPVLLKPGETLTVV